MRKIKCTQCPKTHINNYYACICNLPHVLSPFRCVGWEGGWLELLYTSAGPQVRYRQIEEQRSDKVSASSLHSSLLFFYSYSMSLVSLPVKP